MPVDRWLEITIEADADPELIPPLLLELGGSAVEEASGAFRTYLPPPPDLDGFLEKARGLLERSAPSGGARLSWRWQPQEDWETLWRRGLGPRRITHRLVVSPSWEQVAIGPGEILITLDPGMAFGTAEHATTRGCLRILDDLVEPGARVVDVGAGSGILSIAAARLGAEEVLALEMDGMSCETARENVFKNGVNDRVRVLELLVAPEEPFPNAPFDGIIANLQSHLLEPLLPAFTENLTPDGWLVLSGILLEERQDMVDIASNHGFSLLGEDEEGGWWTGAFRLLPPS
jgi:ribosomal protein L11 methyltransferase